MGENKPKLGIEVKWRRNSNVSRRWIRWEKLTDPGGKKGEQRKQIQYELYQRAGLGNGTVIIALDRTATGALKAPKLVTTKDFIQRNLGKPRYSTSVCRPHFVALHHGWQ
jgi:hypothetical protein